MENTSGGGAGTVVPAEINRWNWGAFLLTWIWGIGNGTLIALLMFVPLVNIPMWFVLGAKGSAWAWQNKRWNSVEEFRRTQRKWALLGVIVPVAFGLLFGGFFWSVMSVMKNSDAYRLAVNELRLSDQVTEVLGTPMTTGFPMGSIKVVNDNGKASLSFSAEGPKGKGTVYIDAVETMGQWRVEHAVFEDEATKRRIELQP